MSPPKRPAKPADRPLMRCPMPHCSGWVVNVEGLPAERTPRRWGCGECATTWRTDEELWASVASIISRFPARSRVYRKKAASWTGIPLAKEPKDYVGTVEKEPWK